MYPVLHIFQSCPSGRVDNTTSTFKNVSNDKKCQDEELGGEISQIQLGYDDLYGPQDSSYRAC